MMMRGNKLFFTSGYHKIFSAALAYSR